MKQPNDGPLGGSNKARLYGGNGCNTDQSPRFPVRKNVQSGATICFAAQAARSPAAFQLSLGVIVALLIVVTCAALSWSLH